MHDKIKLMLEMQSGFNARISDEWQLQGYSWPRAIWTECGELMDHIGWKWWQEQSMDLPQAQLEVVDIWCFCLSLMIQDKGLDDALVESIASGLNSPTFGQASVDPLEVVENFAGLVLGTHSVPVPMFASIMDSMHLDVDGLFSLYVGKMVLNRFRQENGYRTDGYVKRWNGQEDNVHLVEVCAYAGDMAQREGESIELIIYRELDQRYRELVLSRQQPRMPRSAVGGALATA